MSSFTKLVANTSTDIENNVVPNQILTTSVTIPTVSPHIGKPVPLLINLPLTQNSNKPPLFWSQKFPFLRFLGILWGKNCNKPSPKNPHFF